jgi:hypothetical protein
MQSKVKSEHKCTLQMGEQTDSRRSPESGVPRPPKIVLGSVAMGVPVLEN